MIGLVIGKNGETVKSINARTGVDINYIIILGICCTFEGTWTPKP